MTTHITQLMYQKENELIQSKIMLNRKSRVRGLLCIVPVT